jgi:RND family efflux transporter MFP subunit
VNKYVRTLAPVLVLGLGVLAVQGMIAAKPAPEKKEETQRLVSLFVESVGQETVQLTVQSQGEVQAKTEIDLVPRVSGHVLSISDRFAEGAGFEPGESLIKIDDADYRLAVIRAEARVAEAEVRLMQEQAGAEIKRKQWESTGRTSEPSPLQVNRPQVREAEAKLRSAKADLEEARLNLARTEIKLPFRGRVMERAIGVGQYVSAGTRLGRVFATDTVQVELPMTDSQLRELDLPMGFVASSDTSGPAVVLTANVGGQDRHWTGHVVRTHAAVDQQTRLIYAVVEVEDPYGAGSTDGVPLAVGLFVSADIEAASTQNALVMPREALRNADKVYVVNDDDKLEIRTVDVLSSNEERVLVSAGVIPGERVVTSTIPNAVDGMLVQPISSTDADPVAMNL